MSRVVQLRNTGDNYRGSTLVGTGLWNDGSDATSVTITESSATRATHGWVEPLSEDWTKVLWIGVRWRMSVATSGTAMIDVESVFNNPGGGSSAPFTDVIARITGFTADGNLRDHFHEFNDVDYANLGLDMYEVAERLTTLPADPTAVGQRALRFFVVNTSPAQTYVITDGWFELGFPDEAPKLRLYPRDDELGFGGVKRNYPPPRRRRNYGQQP